MGWGDGFLNLEKHNISWTPCSIVPIFTDDFGNGYKIVRLSGGSAGCRAADEMLEDENGRMHPILSGKKINKKLANMVATNDSSSLVATNCMSVFDAEQIFGSLTNF